MSMGAMGRKQRIEQGKDKAYLQHSWIRLFISAHCTQMHVGIERASQQAND